MVTRKIIAASWTVPIYALLLSIFEFSQQTLMETSFFRERIGISFIVYDLHGI